MAPIPLPLDTHLRSLTVLAKGKAACAPALHEAQAAQGGENKPTTRADLLQFYCCICDSCFTKPTQATLDISDLYPYLLR
jgi:hypothetical protein